MKFYITKGWRYDVAHLLVYTAWLLSGKKDYRAGSTKLAWLANKIVPGGCIPDSW